MAIIDEPRIELERAKVVTPVEAMGVFSRPTADTVPLTPLYRSLVAFTDSISPNRPLAVTAVPTLGRSTNVMSVSSSAAIWVMPIVTVSPSRRCHSWV